MGISGEMVNSEVDIDMIGIDISVVGKSGYLFSRLGLR